MASHPILDLYELARERIARTRPDWSCPTPKCGGEMDVRASSFKPTPQHADDMLKCPRCRVTITHGQRVEDPDLEARLRREVAATREEGRGWRRVDFVDDWPTDPPGEQTLHERLAHLGYR